MFIITFPIQINWTHNWQKFVENKDFSLLPFSNMLYKVNNIKQKRPLFCSIPFLQLKHWYFSAVLHSVHFYRLKIPIYRKSSQRKCYYLQNSSSSIFYFQLITTMCIFSVRSRKICHSLNYSMLTLGGQTFVVDSYLIGLIIMSQWQNKTIFHSPFLWSFT